MKKKVYESKYYFVDESGDPELFNRKGDVIVGRPGCSRYFILGFLDVENPKILREKIRALKVNVLNDPYFKKIPSMQIENKKTAISFHAKDDIPEIRHEVYKVLRSFDGLSFIAVVKDKLQDVQYATSRKSNDSLYRYNGNELYDFLTRRLFKNHLHLASKYNIYYSIRGKKPRTRIFGECLTKAQQKFLEENKINSSSEIKVFPTKSEKEPCLQATDYFLWALQRFYVRKEERYLDYLKDMYKLIIDIDDTRNRPYGEYYDSKRNIIDISKIKP